MLGRIDSGQFKFRGIVLDETEQLRRLGQFSKAEAVIPFIRTEGENLYMDLRFAKFLESDFTAESIELLGKEHIKLLETSATGKTKAIFDMGRQKFMLYIRCEVPDREAYNRRQPQREEFISTKDLVFPEVIDLITSRCNTKTGMLTNEEAIEIADGFILADLVARLCFLLWSLKNFPKVTPEQFLVAQLNEGQIILRRFFRILQTLHKDSLEAICRACQDKLDESKVIPIWAMDEAQVVMEKFATYESIMHFEHTADENGHVSIRGLLYQYTSFIVRKDKITAHQLVVAGTALTAYATNSQVSSQLGKPEAERVAFPILAEDDVILRLSRVLNIDDVHWDEVVNLKLLTGRCRWCASVVHFISKAPERDSQEKERVLSSAIRNLSNLIATDMVIGISSRLSDARRDMKAGS